MLVSQKRVNGASFTMHTFLWRNYRTDKYAYLELCSTVDSATCK